MTKIRTSGSPASSSRRRADDGEAGQVAAVETDARVLLETQPADDVDGVGDAAERVVGVDQERRPFGQVGGERTERVELGRERLDVGVRHRPRRRQPEAAGRLDVAGRGEPHHG